MLCLVLLSISLQDSNAQTLEPGQVYTTPNVVQVTQPGGPSTWIGGVYQDNLTCWRGGDPGYCGPNAIVRPGNNINFSYGQTDLHQVQAVASLLPQITGLQVNGYSFRFTAKNGNGWDDGRVDQLSAYVRFFNSSGAVVENNQYNLTYKFNWTDFNFSKDFATPYQLGSLSTVRYGFVGSDNNFWAGPYGPEVTNVSFQLRYSVDPCTTNPLYSTSCSGYLAALNSLVPQQPAPTTPTAQTVVEPQATTTVATAQTTQQVVLAPTPAPQPQAQQQQSQPAGNTQLALSIIARNQDRERQTQASAVQQALDIAQQATQRTEQQAVATAQQSQQQQQDTSTNQQATAQVAATQTAALQPAQRQQDVVIQRAMQDVTQQLVTQTTQPVMVQQAAQQTDQSLVLQVQQQQQQTFVQQAQTAAVAPAQQLQVPQQAAQQVVVAPPAQQQQAAPIARVIVEPTVQQVASTLPQPPQQELVVQPQAQQAVTRAQVVDAIPQVAVQEQPQQQQQTLARLVELETQPSTTLALLDRTNPLSDFLNPQANLSTQTVTSQTQDIRREQQNNELAGGVTLDRMATQPVGYQQYLGLALLDAKFYATREIYGRQTTVDNQRALRQLSSDRLHQQMVNQQYK